MKFIMRKKIIVITYVILIILLLKFALDLVLNGVLIKDYKNSKYSDNIAKAAEIIGFPERYIGYYNRGNILDKKENYEGAMKEYEKALKCSIPKRKECNIRINYALAICNTVEVDEKNKKSIEEAIETYESAIDVLTEVDCANDEGNGHSDKAQELKEDIEKEIKRLKNKEKSEEKEEENDEPEDEQEEEEDESEGESSKTIEEKMKEIKEDAAQVQNENASRYQNYNKKMRTGRTKNW